MRILALATALAGCSVTPAHRLANVPMALLGSGPVYPGLAPGPAPASNYERVRGWLAIKAVWAWPPALVKRRTQVVVRGSRVGAGGPVRFQLGPQWDSAPVTRELRLDTAQTVGGFSGSNWGTTVTMILVEQPGCYRLRLDAGPRSSTIVFRAVRR